MESVSGRPAEEVRPYICTATASRSIDAMSVTTVAISTDAPKRVFDNLSSRMTGKTMPTEWEAKSDA